MSVVQLTTRPTKVVHSVIERLEAALEQAKAGKISAIAIAVVMDDDAMNCAWSDSENVGLLVGSVARLQHRLNRSVDEQ